MSAQTVVQPVAAPAPPRVSTGSGVRQLRPYQVDALDFVRSQDADVCLELPTGAGKTLILCAAVAHALRSGATHALVAAPQRQIEAGFAGHGVAAVQAGGERIELPAGVISSLASGGRAGAVLGYLARRAPGHAAACTHQTLTHVEPERLPADLRGRLLVIDEAHHAPSRGLAAFVSAWRARGGRLVYATATPYRSDWQPVVLPGMYLHRRSLAEHMQEGDGLYAPRHLVNEIVALSAGEDVTAAEFAGEAPPPEHRQDVLVAAMTVKWREDGRPKTIVRVPALRKGSRGLVGKIVAGFRAAGAREVYDATGTSKEHQRAFLRFLAGQRDAGHAAAADVVVGIQRVVEGTDWPVCSNVYLVGLPGSPQTVVQSLGRAMRRKPDDYPEPFRSAAKIVFFAFADDGRTLERLPLEHSRRALLLAAFLADSRAGLEWAVDRAIVRPSMAGLSDGPRGDPGNGPSSGPAKTEAALRQIPPQYRADALLVLAEVLESARRAGRTLSTDEAAAEVGRHSLVLAIPEEDRAVVVPKLLVEILLDQDGGRGGVRASVRRHAARLGHVGADAVLRSVLQEFRTETLRGSRVLDELRTQLHQLTGGDMRNFTRRLTEATSRPIELPRLHAAILAYRERTGGWPSTLSGPCGEVGVDFRQLDHYLRKGIRGLGPDSSLYQEMRAVAAERGLPPPDRDYDTTPLTREQVQGAIRVHFAAHGDTPAKGPTASPLGMTWEVLDRYLREGNRGLAGGSSLVKEVEAFRRGRGLPVKARPGPLSDADVAAAVIAYHEAHGERPTRSSPGLVPGIGVTWLAFENLLKRGGRGLGRSSTVAREVTRALADLPAAPAEGKFTPDEIRGAILDHHRRTGEVPRRDTPGTVETLGVTWGTLNNWLRRDGSTLAERVLEALGPLPKADRLTVERVRAAIRAYIESHGRPPGRNVDGEVPLIGGSWGTLNNNLIKGGRGLPGGSTLAREARIAAGARPGDLAGG